MLAIKRIRTFLLGLTLLSSAACGSRNLASKAEPLAQPLFASNNPRAIYAADPNDSWNRIFGLLFTRTTKIRVARELAEGAPTVTFKDQMGGQILKISRSEIDRTESGDRAIDPLYPSFFTDAGFRKILTDSAFAQFKQALTDALNENGSRPPIARALMQSDAWAAYDEIFRIRAPRVDSDHINEQKTILLGLLQQLIKKTALTTEEIKSLRNNYSDTVSTRGLPDLFSENSGWLEIELLEWRIHDRESKFRRVARVFVKPRTIPADSVAFVESLKDQQHLERVEAVGLLVQNLLINDHGEMVLSPLISEIQFRFFQKDTTPKAVSAQVSQYELSRKLLLTDPRSGGLVALDHNSPAYLAQAGNDYSFMSLIEGVNAPVMVPLHRRCSQCHGESLTTIMTYSVHDIPPIPRVKVLKPSEGTRASYVIGEKQKREDFRSLRQD